MMDHYLKPKHPELFPLTWVSHDWIFIKITTHKHINPSGKGDT